MRLRLLPGGWWMQRQAALMGVALVFVLLLAALVRFHHLGAPSLWNDEGSSYVQSLRSVGEIAENAARDIHPPGYYWLLAGWRLLGGTSEFTLRALSALASLLTVALGYAVGVRLYGRWAGLLAAAFTALNSFSIYYGQEARMYALLALWGAASLWSFVGLVQSLTTQDTRRASRWALALALFNAAGLWTQYAFPLFMLAQGILFLLWWAAQVRAAPLPSARLRPLLLPLGLFVAANLLTLVLFLPWLPTALNQLGAWPNTGDPAASSAEALRALLGWFMFGLTFEISGASAMLFAGAFFLLFGLLLRPPVRRLEWWALLAAVLWVVIPAGLFLALGLYRPANLKFLLPAQLGFALWLARGAVVLWRAQVRDRMQFLRAVPRLAAAAGTFALLAHLLIGLPHLYSAVDLPLQRADYRSMAAVITADARPGDAIILNAPNQQEAFSYYYTGAAPVYALPRGLGGDDPATRAAVEQIIADHERIFVIYWGDAERDPNRIVESTLSASSYEASSQWYGDARLVRYYTPVEFDSFTVSGAQFQAGSSVITLERYALSAAVLAPGDVLQLQLEWRTDAPLDRRYKVFVQLLDAGGVLVAQRDSEPGGGMVLTTSWQPGILVLDRHALMIPNDLTPANYSLILGLYDSDNPQARLPVGGADYLTLATITVQVPSGGQP